MSERSRLGWPVLAVLLVLLAGAVYIAYGTHQDVETPPPRPAPTPPDDPGTWVHHAWVEDAGAPLDTTDEGPLREVPEGISQEAHDRVYDPQRWAMMRELQITDADAGGRLPFEPVERRARVTQLRGAVPFGRGAVCTARLLPARSGRFNCLVRVMCDGHVVYPNPTQTAGYIECDLDAEGRPLRANDVGHTAVDGDPRLRVDLVAGEVVASDAGDGAASFHLRLRLL